jgi:hypothetical protein
MQFKSTTAERNYELHDTQHRYWNVSAMLDVSSYQQQQNPSRNHSLIFSLLFVGKEPTQMKNSCLHMH